jgi:DNA (cytosine-5)-methyltransferase 1
VSTVSGPTSSHLFAGGGGDTRGFAEAGFIPVAGVNHLPQAVQTLRANWPGATWLCENTTQLPMDRLPTTDVMVGSVICTEISPNGGRKRVRRPKGRQMTPGMATPAEEKRFERTFATAYDIMRAADYHRYKVIVVEDVTEFLSDWHLADWWLGGMRTLKYRHAILSMNALHVSGPGNPGAGASRDRVHIVFTRLDVPEPDLTLRPASYCPTCRADVQGVQTWRNGNTIGKYRAQYAYLCPRPGCQSVVEPYTRCAADVFDLCDVGERIRDRRRGYAESTLRRAEKALTFLGTGRTRRPSNAPVRPLQRHHAVLEWRKHCWGASIHEPLTTIEAQGNHHGLLTAPPDWQPGDRIEVGDLHLRTIRASEQARALRFPDHHVMSGGTTKLNTLMAGNAVAVNVAHWLATRIRDVL